MTLLYHLTEENKDFVEQLANEFGLTIFYEDYEKADN